MWKKLLYIAIIAGRVDSSSPRNSENTIKAPVTLSLRSARVASAKRMNTVADRIAEYRAKMEQIASSLTAKTKTRLNERRKWPCGNQSLKVYSNAINLSRLDRFVAANPPINLSSTSACENAECVCRGENAAGCVPSPRDMGGRFAVAPKYGITTCIIQKSMSTVMKAIMCLLFNETRFLAAKGDFAKKCFYVRYCMNENESPNINEIATNFNVSMDEMQKWRYLAVVRNPIDRFLSGFVDKCVRFPNVAEYCHGCGFNITCFMEREYARMMNASRRAIATATFEDRHFFPQNWRCNLSSEAGKYDLLPYSSDSSESGAFLDGLETILADQGVSRESIAFVREQIANRRTDHATVATEARRFYEKYVNDSPYLMELLVKMYYYDFVNFKFPMPRLRNL